MPLHYENKMGKHDESLQRFIEKFNRIEPHNIHAEENTQQFIADAFFIVQGTKLKFDWEKRWIHWIGGVTYPFSSLYQFDRKFKFEVDLTVQCNKTESAIVVAWHKDFGLPFTSRTMTSKGKIDDRIRETRKFMTFSMNELQGLKAFIKLGVCRKVY